jgi:murein DD-endopeptidase MepM/ murein hydrolase activator NlpD
MILGFRHAAAAALFLAAAFPCARVPADTVALTSPVPAVCTTDDGASFSVENGALLPVRGQFMISPPGASELRPRCAVSLDGEPGRLLRMYLWSSEPLDSLSAQIGSPGKTPLAKSSGFRAESKSGTDLWVALIAVPPWSGPRESTLSLKAEAGHRSWLLLQPFSVTARAFFSERIPLTSELTGMATLPDARKSEESRIFAAVLAAAHADAIFETGSFEVPLPAGRRTSGFGDRREYDYSDGSKGYSVHLGVDIASPIGTPVSACGKGRVVFAETRIMTGITVVIEHLPGLFSVYYHMSAVGVKAGELVEKGQVIGAVGMTGFATGPHLHWEVEDSGAAVDPDSLLHGPLLDKTADFFDIEHAIAPKGGESHSLYRSQ